MAKLTAGNLLPLGQNVTAPVLFYKFNFDSGAVLLSTHNRELSFTINASGDYGYIGSGSKFYGIGEAFNSQNKNRSMIGDITPLVEPSNGEVSGQNIKLSGIPQSVVEIALNQPYTNRTCDIFFGWANAGGGVSYMERIAILLIETMSVEVSKQLANVEISLKTRMFNWNKPISRKSTNADQQARFPNDLSHSLVTFTATNNPVWGG